jgi:hypothetical protein
MKHPVQFVIASGGGCFLLGVILFVTGLITDRPSLKTTGCWLGLAAFLIAALPILTLAVVALIEKARRK